MEDHIDLKEKCPKEGSDKSLFFRFVNKDELSELRSFPFEFLQETFLWDFIKKFSRKGHEEAHD